jgi:cytoskeleton protein RodZ
MTPKDDLFEQNDGKGEGAAADQVEGQTEEPQPEPYTGETPGQILRAAREAKGLSTQQVADSLRLRNVVVEIIEADEYDKLSSPTFVRGYLRSFSKALEVDEKRVFEAYRAMGFGEVAASTITMQSFSKRKVRERNDSRLMLISYLIIAIVIAMAVIWWWQDTQAGSNTQSLTEQVLGSGDSGSQSSDQRTPVTRRVTEADVRSAIVDDATGTEAEVSANDSVGGDFGDNTAGDTGTDVETGAETGATNSDASRTSGTALRSETRTAGGSTNTTAAGSTDTGSANTGSANTRPANTGSANTAATNYDAAQAAADQLIITFSDACWVKVTDATDEVLAIGTKVAGYTMPLNGQAPFDVILCKPEAVSMTYNGEQVDLSGYRRNRSVTMTLN